MISLPTTLAVIVLTNVLWPALSSCRTIRSRKVEIIYYPSQDNLTEVHQSSSKKIRLGAHLNLLFIYPAVVGSGPPLIIYYYWWSSAPHRDRMNREEVWVSSKPYIGFSRVQRVIWNCYNAPDLVMLIHVCLFICSLPWSSKKSQILLISFFQININT